MGPQFIVMTVEAQERLSDKLAQAAMQIEVLENKNRQLEKDVGILHATPALDLVAAENAKLKLEVAALKKEIEDRNAVRSKVDWEGIFNLIGCRPKPERLLNAIKLFCDRQYSNGHKRGWSRGMQGLRP
jgi:regulator of replication initiation timing